MVMSLFCWGASSTYLRKCQGGNFLEALHSYTHSCWARSRILCCGPFLLGILKLWCYYHLPLGVALEKVQPVLIPFPFIVVTCILFAGSFPSSIYLSFLFFSFSFLPPLLSSSFNQVYRLWKYCFWLITTFCSVTFLSFCSQYSSDFYNYFSRFFSVNYHKVESMSIL